MRVVHTQGLRCVSRMGVLRSGCVGKSLLHAGDDVNGFASPPRGRPVAECARPPQQKELKTDRNVRGKSIEIGKKTKHTQEGSRLAVSHDHQNSCGLDRLSCEGGERKRT